jgi:hypothetical protein
VSKANRFTLEIDDRTLAIVNDLQARLGLANRKDAIVKAIRIAGAVTEQRVFLQNGDAEMKEVIFL